MLFIEFLASNVLSCRVIMNYISGLKYTFARYRWSCTSFSHNLVLRLLKGFNYSVRPNIKPKGVIIFPQICEISLLCDLFESSLTYRTAFLLTFMVFLEFQILHLLPYKLLTSLVTSIVISHSNILGCT